MEKHISSGVIGGLVGGVVFGMMMMGMMPMIAMMVGSESAVVGWIVHLLISAGTGALFVVVFGNMISSYLSGAGYGLLYGIIWWVLGALILMPVILGITADMNMGVQLGNAGEHLSSLKGHLVFGLLLGLVYVAHSKKGGSAM